MPIILKHTNCDPICSFCEWEILGEAQLIEVLAWLYLRKPQHAVQIINQLAPSKAGFPGKIFENAIELLSIKIADIQCDLSSADPDAKKKAENKRAKRIEQRDGLLFQHVSWIAASLAMPSALAAPPHVRKADKGFDGLFVQVSTTSDAISSLVLCEDKASVDPKKLVQNGVWNEIDHVVAGEKDLELLDAVTALLREQRHLPLEKILDDVVFEQVRAYRIAVTTMPANLDSSGYQHIFTSFDSHAIGPVNIRHAEVMETNDTRAFLKYLARKVRREIRKLADSV
jgi:hypothetical protein